MRQWVLGLVLSVLAHTRITRVVLGKPSEPLDVGREQRLVTAAMRKALTARSSTSVIQSGHGT